MLNKISDNYICHWPIIRKVMRGPVKSLSHAEYTGSLIQVPKA